MVDLQRRNDFKLIKRKKIFNPPWRFITILSLAFVLFFIIYAMKKFLTY
ncbi:MAG: hypothetical protein ABIK73_00335 [candidate division WOR-3 bacterium]